ncbi:PQQ-containing dehydrogenase 2 [Kozakia baliensis NRIC 0488]|uniref:Dehydrogenase n=2 Tax=Kozakia baliensis TaxID=153496 RepID=A0A1D8US60_9PROT|nr:PQQ-binding-like beta-propeller repeat protein [Kozakia baliensis]AOX16474.1 dehydrogenase [Kozakia baliensis]AOX19433.1 dehydrogenase [Kozakia baliensis]GBR29148.1 PQQ-containing dehydrogenase 2 [Kozakia baliensis NRIC 0488]GEL63438.1 pyrrolo-quinoline quinone [Kozakia baliensis]
MRPISKTNGPALGRRRFMGSLLVTGTALSGCGIFKDDPKPPLAGKRVDVLSTGAGLTIDHEDHTPIQIPSAQPITAWPQVGRTPNHVSIDSPWNGPNLQWRKSIGSGISEPTFLHFVALGPNGRGAIQSPPVIANGRIFTRDAVGTVRAWSWPELTQIWTFVPKPKKARSSDIGGGLGISGDTLYIVDGVGQAIAVEAASGKVKWRADTTVPGRSAPTIVDGRVFFGTIDEKLYALNAETGEQIWTYQATDADTVIFGQAAPAVVNGIVVAGFGSGDLVALRATSGELVWSDSLGGSNGRGAMLDLSCVRGAPIIQDGTAYAISLSKVLVAIDMRSGRRLWEREISGQNTPVIVGDWLYVISSDQQLACLDRLSGHVRWIKDLRRFKRISSQKDAVTWSGPVLAGGKLVCVSSLPEVGMQVIDAQTGKDLGVTPTKQPSLVEPIICDGKVLVLSTDGYLSAYG